jgi:hypothetical protein
MTHGEATAILTGPAQLRRAARKRVADALRQEKIVFSERSDETAITIHFAFRAGVPFPAFVSASEQYPACVVQVAWQARSTTGRHEAVGGAVTLQAGKPLSQTANLSELS